MNSKTVWFGLKLMLAAAGISLAVKYGGPYLALPETLPVVVGMMVLPTLILAGILWRWQLQSPSSRADRDPQANPENTSSASAR